MVRPQIALLITDLDNTIYDWLGAFVPAFYAMVHEAARLISVHEEELLDDLQTVHRAHGDSEHPFALLETRAVRNKFGDQQPDKLIQILDPAFHAFNRVRKQNLKLYEGVYETLEQLSNLRIRVVAYTDARVINSLFRIEQLGIRKFITCLYSPSHKIKEVGNSLLNDELIHLLPPGDRKPNPQTLIDICKRYRVAPKDSLYVGDSLVRDVHMANRAGLHSAWARFGTLYDKTLWPKLVRITHWTEADVEREQQLAEQARGTEPDCILESFSDIVRWFEFPKNL